MFKITIENLIDLNLPVFQAHGDVPSDYVREIAESIKIHGVLQPLIVRDTDKGLEIVAGCIRYKASLLAGLKAIPCINMSLDSQGAEVVKLHENSKRVPLGHVSEGYTFLNMFETFGMSEKDISECSGKSVSYVSQHISLVRLGNELTEAVKEGSISFSQARELMRVTDVSERNRFLKYCQQDGATVQTLQRWIQDYLRTTDISPPSNVDIPDQVLEHNDPHISRFCDACGKSVEISKIRQVFYCPACHHAIKSAISDENARLSSETPDKSSEDAPG